MAKTNSAKASLPKPKIDSAKQGNGFVLGAIIILIATFLAYLPVRQASFIWDDNIMLTENSHMTMPGGLSKIWFSTEPHDYFPLTMTSLWIEWRMWGKNPAGYLFVNVFLHAIGAILLWQVMKRLRIPAPWLCGLIFALHPVAVASVAWVAERKNTLSLVFFALTFLTYFQFESSGQRKWYGLALMMFLLALLSKTSVVMVPVLLLGCAWWQREEISRRDILRSIPFFAMSLVLGLITIWFQKHRAIGENATDIPVESMGVRLLGGSWGVWFYLWKAIAPVHLSAIYPRWEINPSSVLAYLPGLLWVVAFGLFWKFRRTWGKPFLFCFVYFALTLLPILGFFSMSYLMHSRVADHWQYLALIAPIALMVGVGEHLLKKHFGAGSVVSSVGLVAAAVLFGLTYRMVAIHSHPEKMWLETLKGNPAAWAAHNNLGRLYVYGNETEKAVYHFGEAVRLKPDSPQTQYNLGRLLLGQGKVEPALIHLSESARLGPENPQTRLDWGEALFQANRIDEAVTQFKEAVRLNPNFSSAHNFLGSIFGQKNMLDEAIEHYSAAIRLRPDFFEAQFNLGFALAKKGRGAEAKKYFMEALRLNPTSGAAHRELAKIYEMEGDVLKAAMHGAEASYLRGMSFLQKNQPEAARSAFEESVRLNPDHTEARRQLGR